MAGVSEASPDSDDGQPVVNAREISFIAGDERDVQRDGDRRNEEIESARLRVSANGSNRGAQRAVNPRSAGINGIGSKVLVIQ